MTSLQDTVRQHGQRIEELLLEEIPQNAVPFVSEGVWYQFASGGKRLRPALCLLSCDLFGGKSQDALQFALATELLHNFFLVHDDIEDGDTMRRDRPTLWSEVGMANGINIGDYLLAKAYAVIFKSPLSAETILELGKIFSSTFERTVEGQALDINLRGSRDVGLEVYYRIVQLKTAYYLAVTWVGGAIIAGRSRETLDPLWELGKCLGPAFQIRDDLLDLTDGKGRGGEIGCDLREGKPSILYAYALDREVGSTEERERLRDIMSKSREETGTDDVNWAIKFFDRTGALDFARKEASKLIERADQVIDSLPLDEAGREVFRTVSRYIVERKT